MAAKKGAKRGSKKKVTLNVDADLLRRFSSAVAALSVLAAAMDFAADDPKLRKELLKSLKKRR